MHNTLIQILILATRNDMLFSMFGLTGPHKRSGEFFCMPEIMGDTRVNE